MIPFLICFAACLASFWIGWFAHRYAESRKLDEILHGVLLSHMDDMNREQNEALKRIKRKWGVGQ